MWKYLQVNHANGYIEQNNGNIYLVFVSIYKNKEVLKKYNKILGGIKNKIKKGVKGIKPRVI